MITELLRRSPRDDFGNEGECIAESCIEIGLDFSGVNKYFPYLRSERKDCNLLDSLIVDSDVFD